MSNKQLAAKLVNTALSVPPKTGKPLVKWRDNHLFRRLPPWQYDVIKELVEDGLNQRDECREVAIKALMGAWVDYFHMPYDTFDEKHDAMCTGVLVNSAGMQTLYQFTAQSAADWFDKVRKTHSKLARKVK